MAIDGAMSTATKSPLQEKIKLHKHPSTLSPSSLSISVSIADIEFEANPRTNLERSSTSSSTNEDFTILPEVEIDRPLTPTLRNLSISPTLDNSKLETSPSTSSERSNNSTSINADTPITQRSRSSTATTFEEKGNILERTIVTAHNPCLQCHIRGLRCSFSQSRYTETEVQRKTCARCARNGEEFCIVQIKTEYGGRRAEYEYLARGVEKGVVAKKAEKLLGEGKGKNRFVLPRCNTVVRERFFARWEEMKEGELDAWVGCKVIHETRKTFWYGQMGLRDWSQVVETDGSLDE